MNAYQEICDNLSALEAFPKQRIREVGGRIHIPVKPDGSVLAFLWHNAGLNKKQIRKLLGTRYGCFVSSWGIERMITNGKHVLDTRETIAALRLDRKEAYWREKWRHYKGRSKWQKVKPKRKTSPLTRLSPTRPD